MDEYEFNEVCLKLGYLIRCQEINIIYFPLPFSIVLRLDLKHRCSVQEGHQEFG